MSAIQLSFSLRTSPGCKTVHLLGNWDNYRGQLPLSKDSSSSKSGAWRGSFKFSGNSLQQGQRYWYYYIIDGYHPSHDPAQPSTVEPTTKRQLNILDIPTSSSSTSSRTRDRHGAPSLSLNTRGSTSSSSRYTSTTRAPPGGSARKSSHSPPRHSKSSSGPVQGRSLSPSNILHPRPQKPHATRGITTARYSQRDMDALTRHMSRTHVSASSFSSDDSGSSISDSESDDSEIDSDYSADSSLDRRRVPSLSSGSSSPRSRGSRSGSGSGSSSPGSSLASPLTPRSPAGSPCVCERWGRDRRGRKVRMECGGKSCGSGSGSDLGSSDSDGRGSSGSGGYKTRVVGRGGGGEKRLGYVMRAGGVSRR